MSNISELMANVSQYLEAQRALGACQQRATSDIDNYSYSLVQDFQNAEEALQQALDRYVDRRIAQVLNGLKAPAP